MELISNCTPLGLEQLGHGVWVFVDKLGAAHQHGLDAAGAAKLPTAPISDDAEIITSLFVKAHLMGRGIEAVLVDAAIMHLTNRGSTAVEAFGYYGDPAAAADFLGHKPAYIGLMSYETLRSAGFEVAADHPVLPRLRLELPPEHDMLSAAAAEDLLARALA